MKRALVVAVSGLGLFCAAVAVEGMTRQQSNVEEAPEQIVATKLPFAHTAHELGNRSQRRTRSPDAYLAIAAEPGFFLCRRNGD